MLLGVNLLWDCTIWENLWTEVVMGSRYEEFLNIYSKVLSLQFIVILISCVIIVHANSSKIF
jgi:hypothetical protein